MATEKTKIKLSDLREIEMYATTVPLHKAMGFKVDSRITRLAAEAKALIEYEIGDDLKTLKKSVDEITEPIRQPFLSEWGELPEEEKEEGGKVIDAKIYKALSENEELKALGIKEDELWKKQVGNELEPIEIEEKEYSEKFGDPILISLYGREIKLDGYYALLQLISKNIITIKDGN